MMLLIKNIGLLILLLLMFTILFITSAICIYVIANIILGMKD